MKLWNNNKIIINAKIWVIWIKIPFDEIFKIILQLYSSEKYHEKGITS